MTTRLIARLAALALLAASTLVAPLSAASAAPSWVPSLDEMAGDWTPAVNAANPPAVHNFHDMLLVGRDLTSLFCHPEDWLWSGRPKRG